jgi:hypothetical protein
LAIVAVFYNDNDNHHRINEDVDGMGMVSQGQL